MSVKNDAFPASAAFDLIGQSLQDDAAERQEAIKNAGAVFGFTLKNAAGSTESWHLDLKDKGVVGKGAAPAGGKADVTLSLSDDDFGKLVKGDTQAQRLFMAGKLKIKGNMMKAMKLEPIFQRSKPKAKL